MDSFICRFYLLAFSCVCVYIYIVYVVSLSMQCIVQWQSWNTFLTFPLDFISLLVVSPQDSCFVHTYTTRTHICHIERSGVDRLWVSGTNIGPFLCHCREREREREMVLFIIYMLLIFLYFKMCWFSFYPQNLGVEQ